MQVARQYDICSVALPQQLPGGLLHEAEGGRDEEGDRRQIDQQPHEVDSEQAQLEGLNTCSQTGQLQ